MCRITERGTKRIATFVPEQRRADCIQMYPKLMLICSGCMCGGRAY